MSKSAFAELLEEARDRLRQRHRQAVPLAFDWDATSGPESWSAWANIYVPGTDSRRCYFGSTGEEALRRLVEALRASTT